MDSETAALIIVIQLQDIAEIHGRRKGKEREGAPDPDSYLAWDLYRDELERDARTLSDQCLARSISRAVYLDGPALAISKAEEDIAIQDRQLAYQLSGSRPQTPLPAVIPTVNIGEELATQFAAWNAFGLEGEAEDIGGRMFDRETGESSQSNPTSSRYQGPGVAGCVACGDFKKTSKLMRATCGHSYCMDCINELFEHATKDESLFPPRCCRSLIPLSNARPYLDSGLIKRFERKAVELKTPNRTYCHNATCSEFIPLENIDGDRATCVACLRVTCAICKAWAHDGDCPKDPALESLMAVATEAGYQKCHKCKRLVELDTGCNHMT
ncbi:MAG: hypothetical protein M1839_002028 [Geoglossum umbratile]|nr:MAG: hypothetical protein M1839_002028 [Geoglossum umbratile]